MNKLGFSIMLFLLLSFNCSSQNSTFFENVRIGGSVNIGVSNGYSSFSLTPSAIYDFSENFSAGVSLNYVYVKTDGTLNRVANIFGGSVLSLVKISNSIQFSTEYQRLNINDKLRTTNETVSDWQDALYLGVEFVTGNFSMGLRYDVLYDKLTNLIYPSALTPVFRIYF